MISKVAWLISLCSFSCTMIHRVQLLWASYFLIYDIGKKSPTWHGSLWRLNMIICVNSSILPGTCVLNKSQRFPPILQAEEQLGDLTRMWKGYTCVRACIGTMGKKRKTGTQESFLSLDSFYTLLQNWLFSSVAGDRLHAVASERLCTMSLAVHHIPQQCSGDKNQMIGIS